MEQTTDFDPIEREVDDIAAEVARDCAAIAEELGRLPAHAPARIASVQHSIARHVRRLTAATPRLHAAEAQLMAEARARAAKEGGRPLLPQRWYDLRTRADRLRFALNSWHSIQTLIAAQMAAPRRPLYNARSEQPSALVTQIEVSDVLFTSLHRLMTPQDQTDDAQAHGCYPDIGLANSAFLEHAHAAYRVFLAQRHRRRGRFLDVGCGAGLKVVAATEFFEFAVGIDFDPPYVQAAKRLFQAMGIGQCAAMEADALAFEDYAEFDVIYFYRPMRGEAQMRALEARIVEQARPGTILIAPYDGFGARHGILGCARIAGNLFLAHGDEEAAEALRIRAEHMGPSVRRRETAVVQVWEPVLAASHANGYGISRLTPFRI